MQNTKTINQSATAYLRQLHELLLTVDVTDRRTAVLSLDEGTNKATDIILSVKSASGKVMLIGNGGSAAIASHQALDFWHAGSVRAMAFSDSALLTCMSNDYGYENVFAKSIEMFADSRDVLIAISSSGCSPNITRAVQVARAKECDVITFSGFDKDNSLRSLGDLNFYVASNVYGYVEIAHLALIHTVADMIKTRTTQWDANEE